MSAEYERVFSSIKKLITPERNRLNKQSIEASEYLKNWWDRGLITQQEDAEVTYEGSDIESESEGEGEGEIEL
jgi:hAT family C-terminal dimerisation region